MQNIKPFLVFVLWFLPAPVFGYADQIETARLLAILLDAGRVTVGANHSSMMPAKVIKVLQLKCLKSSYLPHSSRELESTYQI